jgi:phosphoribosylaminoimidazole-succinocarboxamide synthase
MPGMTGFTLLRSGKVRDVYSVDDDHYLMIVASDRISAFDYVLPTPIPDKGVILTRLSNFWFTKTTHLVANHIVSTQPSLEHWQDDGLWQRDQLCERSVLVLRAEPLPIEAIVRGYLAGSGWNEYRRSGSVCGILLPPGLREAEQLPEPIFTPSTKAQAGAHDENISFAEAVDLVGLEIAEKVKDISLQLYNFAQTVAKERGIIIADTKFEFGLLDGEIILIDELFTPDSSRFWPADAYQPGTTPASFDKQFVRDYLEQSRWKKQPPAPELPAHIVSKTAEKYKEALTRLTNDSWEATT